MKIETFFLASRTDDMVGHSKAILVVAGTALALLAIYWPTAHSIFAIWQRSDTFAHSFLVVPAVIWLIWRDRRVLRIIPVRPCFAVLAALGSAGFLWMAGQLATVSVASQFALLFMVQLSIVTILGLRIARRIAFPLAFLVFAIPFGDFLLPWLMDRTADATVLLLKVSGVPVYREGNSIQIPSGHWSVVEACSGLRYLIASVVAGIVYAHVRYTSFARKLTFIGAAIAVPLAANWLRAYGIVMLAHHTDNRLGTTVDHVIYGWLFFGVVMALLFSLGALWQETQPSTEATQATPGNPAPRGRIPIVSAGLLCVMVAAIWPIALGHLRSPQHSAPPVLSGLKLANGWTESAAQITSWRPRFINASSELSQVFTKNGQKVGLYVAYYRNQHGSSKLVSTENVLVRADDADWKITSDTGTIQPMQRAVIGVRNVVANARAQRLAIREWFWVDGHYTGSQYTAAALILAAQLRKQSDDAVAIITYTPTEDDQEMAAKILDSFAVDMAEPLSQLFAAINSPP